MSGFEKVAASRTPATAILGALFDLTPSGVFQKTGTHRQAQLDAPLAGLPKIPLR
jgi:hypothetical protein